MDIQKLNVDLISIRCLFSWLSSWSGTCVRCFSSTQLQVQTSAIMSTFRFDPSFSALHDWVLLSRCSRISAAPPAGLGAPAQVRCGHQSERGVTERQSHPTSVLLGRGMKRVTSDLQILHASRLASSRVCLCLCAGDQFSAAGPDGWSPAGAVQTGVSAGRKQLCVQTHGRPVTDHAHI